MKLPRPHDMVNGRMILPAKPRYYQQNYAATGQSIFPWFSQHAAATVCELRFNIKCHKIKTITIVNPAVIENQGTQNTYCCCEPSLKYTNQIKQHHNIIHFIDGGCLLHFGLQKCYLPSGLLKEKYSEARPLPPVSSTSTYILDIMLGSSFPFLLFEGAVSFHTPDH